MAYARRLLPSMSLLTAFEAAARHESFTAAAEELCLTQSAVSRQIKVLEEALGADLFVRERQMVKLTGTGQTYAAEIRDALRHIATATLTFRANPKGGTLNLAILPTFGAEWLAPRLSSFTEAEPEITVNLTTRLAPFDFENDHVDAAIHYGASEWAGAELDFLLAETVVPVCNPALRERHGFEQAADLASAPLLHLVSRPDAWEIWFHAQELEIGRLHGMLFDQFSTIIRASVAGLGVGLIPRLFIERELARGELIEAVPDGTLSTQGYYLAWPVRRSNHPPLTAFRSWLIKEAARAA